MSCPDFSRLMQLLDGELSGEEAGEVMTHLEVCKECLALLETQKRMESVWRESWKDPDNAAFETLRGNLSPAAVPWWRRQRSWMAVAAVFAVYLGVKIFLIDGAGRPMAELVSESSPAPRTEHFAEPEVPSGVPDESADVPLVEQEIPEQQEEEVMSPAEEQQEEAEETDFPAPIEEVVEDVTVSHSQSLSMGESSGYGADRSIGAASGGLISEAHPNEGLAFTRDSASGAMVSGVAALPADIQVSAELQGGDTISLHREDWPELFQILDTILAHETIPEGEPVVLFIDSTGLATGPLVPEGTMIALPDSTYAGCSVTAFPF